MASGGADLEARWPAWPEGEPGTTLLDVVLGLSVDEAFALLYGGLTDMRKALNEAAGNKEYSTTAWVEGAQAVEAAAGAPTPPPLQAGALGELRVGMLRRASYSGAMMGSKFRNDELIRLVEAAPGASWRMQTTVLTNAMHGDKFRPIVASHLQALPGGQAGCRYTVRTLIHFVSKPNGFIKAMIDKGAREGQRKNFDALRKALAQFTSVSEAAAALAAGVPAAAEAAVEAAPAAGAEPAAAAGLLEAVVGAPACTRLAPWSAWLHGQLAAVAPGAAAALDPRLLLGLLGVGCLLGALRLVVDMLLFVQHASAEPRDSIGLVTHYALRLVDVPESLQEVLVSCLIFYTVRLLVNRLAGALPPPPAPAALLPAPAAAAAAASKAAAGGAVAGAAAGATAAAKGARSEEAEGEGIKYEGYEAAIAAAQAQPTSPATGSPGDSAAAGPDKPGSGGSSSSIAWKSFSKSITGAFAPATRGSRPRSVSAAPGNVPLSTAAAGAAAAAALSSPPAAASPLQQGLLASSLLPTSDGSEDGGEGLRRRVRPAPASARASMPASLDVARVRSLSEGDALVKLPAAAAATAAAAAGLGATSPPRSVASEASAGGGHLSPDRSLSPGRPSGGPLAHCRSAGVMVPDQADDPGHSSVARWFTGVLPPSAKVEGASGGDGAPGDAPSEETLSPSAAQRSFRPAMPAHLAPELSREAVIEEVFENQRLQPFRGWGHTWPGHFLPTDRVNHWSRREHEGFPVLAGAEFAAIAPPLPEGWQWCEEKWHLDLSGLIIDACDSEGWAYGLDFGYVKYPFLPGSGKKKVTDFVRRRRWIRTRVPLALPAQPRPTAISADSLGWSEAAEAAALAAALVADASTGAFASTGSEVPAAAAGPLAAALAAAAQEGAGEGEGVAASPNGGGSAAAAPSERRQEQAEVQAALQAVVAEVEERAAVEAGMAEALARPMGSASTGSASPPRRSPLAPASPLRRSMDAAERPLLPPPAQAPLPAPPSPPSPPKQQQSPVAGVPEAASDEAQRPAADARSPKAAAMARPEEQRGEEESQQGSLDSAAAAPAPAAEEAAGQQASSGAAGVEAEVESSAAAVSSTPQAVAPEHGDATGEPDMPSAAASAAASEAPEAAAAAVEDEAATGAAAPAEEAGEEGEVAEEESSPGDGLHLVASR